MSRGVAIVVCVCAALAGAGIARGDDLLATKGPIATIRVDDAAIYVQAMGALVRVDKQSGESTTLAPVVSYAIAIDDVFVYYADADTVLWKRRKDGSDAAAKVADGVDPSALAVDDGWIYVSGQGEHAVVERIAKKDGKITVLAKDESNPSDLAIDADSVYWTTNGTEGGHKDGAVRKVAKKGGKPTTLAKGQDTASAIAVIGKNVIWLNEGWDEHTGQVVRVANTGGTPRVLAGKLSSARDLVVDGGRVYFTELAGNLDMLDEHEKQSTIATPANRIQGLAVDAKWIYYGEADSDEMAAPSHLKRIVR